MVQLTEALKIEDMRAQDRARCTRFDRPPDIQSMLGRRMNFLYILLVQNFYTPLDAGAADTGKRFLSASRSKYTEAWGSKYAKVLTRLWCSITRLWSTDSSAHKIS